MASSCGSSDFDLPYNLEIEDFKAKIVQFWKDNLQGFPNLHESSSWKVYLLSKDLFGHYSLMFQVPNQRECLVIELLVINKQTNFSLRVIDVNNERYHNIKAKDLGVITEKAGVILEKAYCLICQMGSYNVLFNNCQDYCKHLAEDIGCHNDFSTIGEVTLDTIASGAAVVGIVAGAALLYAVLSGSNKNSSSK